MRAAAPLPLLPELTPSVSMSLIPLSGSGLCDAVTISPTAKPPLRRDRRAANAPMRKKVESRSSALARKPAVPYASGTFGPSGPREVGMWAKGWEGPLPNLSLIHI